MKKLTLQLIIAATATILINSSVLASTQIRAHISAVRIVVINKNRTITAVYSNTDQVVTPVVHALSADGPTVNLDDTILIQYKTIMQTVPSGATGAVYQRLQTPSFIEMLYAMLKP